MCLSIVYRCNYSVFLVYYQILMAMKCNNCAKGVLYGHNVSHAKNRTNRVFKPNLHSTRVKIGPTMVRMKLCTKCLRSYKSLQALIDAPVETTIETSPETPTVEVAA
jgi:large subunit ribosomal protein L28